MHLSAIARGVAVAQISSGDLLPGIVDAHKLTSPSLSYHSIKFPNYDLPTATATTISDPPRHIFLPLEASPAPRLEAAKFAYKLQRRVENL